MQEHIKTSSQSPIQGQLPAQNVFEMRKILDNPSKKSIHIQFPTVKMPNNSQDHYHPTLLSFNNDGQFFTPSFMLNLDKMKLKQNWEIYRDQFNRKMQLNQNQKQQLFIPQPSKMNRFCCICREHFDDYLTHLNTQKHQNLLKESKFNADIESLCEDMSRMRGLQKKGVGKKKKIEKKGKKLERKNGNRKNFQLASTPTQLSFQLPA